MRFFEKLVATTNDYRLQIVEDVPEVGFCFIVNSKDGKYIQSIYKDTLQACKELALKMYNVPMHAWRSEGKYFESWVATNSQGHTFRIKGDLPEVGFYLHAFDKNKNPIDEDLKGYSDLQDTVQVCKEVALKVFGLPIDAWNEE